MSGLNDRIVDERALEDLEGEQVDAHLEVLADKWALLAMKNRGFIRKRDVNASWSENTSPYDPVATLGGAKWLRIVTEPPVLVDGGKPTGRRVSEVHFGDCLRGSLDGVGPLLCKLTNLRILYLHDNPSLVGRLEKIRCSHFPLLEQFTCHRTGIETKQGLSMLASNFRLKYIDVSNCRGITGTIPESLLNFPGLRIVCSGTHLEGLDSVGNDARASARWGRKHLARIPGAP